MTSRYLGILAVMCLVDMAIPLPILGAILIYVVLNKPIWFRALVEEVYTT